MRIFYTTVLSIATALCTTLAVAGDDLEEAAREALVAFTEAVRSGPEALAPLLAPEYQIMRANGSGYDRRGYLETGAGKVSLQADYSHEDIIATVDDGVMVARYYLRVNETIEGQAVEQRAPRLTVFRRVDGQWKVVAHANFGATR